MNFPHSARRALLSAVALSLPLSVSAAAIDIGPQMQCIVDRGIIPGAVTLVSRDGRRIHESVVGYQDIESRKRMSQDTLFRLYSMSKPITSVAILMLAERGALSLDSRVEDFIPAFRDMRVYASGDVDHLVTTPLARAITLRDLLTHTSGLTYHFTGSTPVHQFYRRHGVKRDTPVGSLPTDGAPAHSLEELVDRLAHAPLLRQPGQAFDYSYATTVLGHVIERVSGRTLDRFLQEELFKPLKMTHTGFFVQGDALKSFATNYQSDAGLMKAIENSETTDYRDPKRLLDGGGALASTASDYLRFAQMLANGGTLDGVRILEARTVADMLRDQLPASAKGKGPRPNVRFEFGHGLQIGNESTAAEETMPAGAAGWDGSANTFFWVDPRRKEAVVGMTQVIAPGGLAINPKQVVYRALHGDAGSKPPFCRPGN